MPSSDGGLATPGAGAPGELSAEDQCVVLLGRGVLTPALEARARALLGRPLAWPTVLRQARRHGVGPLLSRNLARLGWPGVPDDARARLAVGDRLNAARNALLVRELTELLGRCRGRGVPVIPLKGPALAERLYGDRALRECWDLDLLVPPRATAAVRDLLAAHGYTPAAETPFGAEAVASLLESTCECAFVRRRQEFWYVVDVHWHVAWRWHADAAMLADLWAEARPASFGGVEAWGLSPEWELLFLMVHAARHRWQPLKWLVDVHEICQRGEVNWQRLQTKATKFGLGRVLALTLGACSALLGTEIPEGLPRQAPPPWLPLFPAPPLAPDVWADCVLPVRLFARPSQKLGYLARLAFVPAMQDRAVLRLPPALEGLYYGVRPARLVGKLGRELGRWSAATVRGAGRRVAAALL